MKKISIVALFVLLIAAGCNNIPAQNNTASNQTPAPDAPPVTATMYGGGKTPVYGTVTATQYQGSSVFNIALHNSGADTYKAALVNGSCQKPGTTKYNLTDVVQGQSSTTLAVALKELINTSVAVLVNNSAGARISCGDIVGVFGTSTSTTTPVPPTPAPSGQQKPLTPPKKTK